MASEKHYVCKIIKDVKQGEIILHPVYRKDRLLLIDRYKTMQPEYLTVLNKQLPSFFWAVTAKNNEDFNAFINNKEYQDVDFLEYLLRIANQYKNIVKVPLTIDDFKEKDIDIEIINGKISAAAKKDEGDYFVKSLLQVSSFKTFEYNLDNNFISERASLIRKKIFEEIYKNKDLQKQFFKLRLYDDILFIHSANSTSMALLMGLCLELSDDMLVDLAIASLFADIGFTEISKHKFKLYLSNLDDNNNIYKEQIEKFLNIARNTKKLREEKIVNAIIDRHENFDGSGFPNGKKGNEINLLSRIIYICQTYDQLINGYRGITLTPMQAIRVLWDDIGKKFDPDILKLYIYRTNYFKIGRSFYTDSGEQATIIGFEDFINKPVYPILKIDK